MVKDEKDQSKEPQKPTAYIADLADFQPDPDNLNLHTQRGQALVTQSQQKVWYWADAVISGTLASKNCCLLRLCGNSRAVAIKFGAS